MGIVFEFELPQLTYETIERSMVLAFYSLGSLWLVPSKSRLSAYQKTRQTAESKLWYYRVILRVLSRGIVLLRTVIIDDISYTMK